MPSPADALPGRAEPIAITERHHVNGASLTPPWPDGARTAVFGLGCFWGAEKAFWQTEGVISTAVGYAGGYTPNPTYEETCTGRPATPRSCSSSTTPRASATRAC